jgi:hypothetical protein
MLSGSSITECRATSKKVDFLPKELQKHKLLIKQFGLLYGCQADRLSPPFILSEERERERG